MGWDYNFLPNSRTASRTLCALCVFLCARMMTVIALAAVPHYELKVDVFTSFPSSVFFFLQPLKAHRLDGG